MPAVFADLHNDIWIAGDLRIAKRPRRHERIVLGRDDERRDANPVDDAHRAGAMVVIPGVPEPEMRRRVRIVELPDGPDGSELREVESARPEPILAPHPRLEVSHEIPLIQKVLALLERAHALFDLDDRRYCGDRDQRR